MRYCSVLPVMLMLACGAGNGNGHERWAGDYHDDSPGTIAVASDEKDSAPLGVVDGQWWCYDLHAPQPEDGASDCNRTKKRCEYFRNLMVKHKRKPSKQCKPQRTAFCFVVQFPKVKRIEVCLRTGQQCETLEKKTRRDPNVRVWPCAEQTNDKPPSGGVF